MKLDDPYPALSSAQSAVLLICFMPLTSDSRSQRTSLTDLANSLQIRLVDLVRVLRVDAANHPDVMQSFAITQTPAFVLIRRGVELWRQVGLSDDAALFQRVHALVDLAPIKSQVAS